MLRKRSMFLAAVVCGLMAVSGPRDLGAAAPTSQPASFHFAVIADPHTADNRGGEPTGVEKLHVVLKKIDSLSPKPEFVLILGDIHVDAFKKALAEIDFKIPLHVIAGNHENVEHRKLLRDMFPDDFKGRDFYSFTHRDYRFLGVCDAIPQDHVGHLSSEFITGSGQCGWLAAQLAEAREKGQRCVLFAHVPPHPEGKDQNMFLAVNDQRFLRELAEKYHPAAVFFGHLHQAMDFNLAGTPVHVAPSANWNMGGKPTGFLDVAVTKDGIQATFVPVGK